MKKCKCGNNKFTFYKVVKVICESFSHKSKDYLIAKSKEDETKNNDQLFEYIYCTECGSRYLKKDFNIINNLIRN